MAEAANPQSGLIAHGVSVEIGGTSIVRDISISAEDGEFVGVIGPNGSGKTTVLKTLYKVITPSVGTISLNDRDLRRARPAAVAKQLAVVSQFQSLSFNLTVHDMVSLGRNPHLKNLQPISSHDRAVVTAAINEVGLTDRADQNIQTLSGGESQRVALARALAQEPSFLILDEPTNHLDIRHQLHVLDIVKGLAIGTIAALHDLHLAARYCDRVYVMNAGQVVDSGAPADILTKELIGEVYGVECEPFRDPRGFLAFSYSRDAATARNPSLSR